MLIDIDIDPSEMDEGELTACVQYAKRKGIWANPLFEGTEETDQRVRAMYEYFALQTRPAPQSVRDFFWHLYGKLV